MWQNYREILIQSFLYPLQDQVQNMDRYDDKLQHHICVEKVTKIPD